MANFSNDVGFGDYATEQADIDRRRKYAEALQEQSMQPIQPMRSNSGFSIPISPTQGLAQMLKAYIGKTDIEKAKSEQQALGQRARNEFSAWAAEMPQATSRDLNLVQNDDEGNAMPAAMQTTPPTQQQMMAWALKGGASGNPYAAQMAQPFLAQALKMNDPYTLGEGQKRFQGSQVVADGGPRTFAPPAPQRPIASQVPGATRTIQIGNDKVTQELQPDGSYKEIARGPAFAKSVPSVVMPSTPKVPIGYRQTADGNLQAIPGGPADIKTQKQQEQVEGGRSTVNTLIADLRDKYRQLQEADGITDPNKGALSNISAGIQSSAAGQAAGKLFGTQNQSNRNAIAQTRPLLLNAIKQATGMSARQMDSNAELKMYLSAATDPTLDIAANMNALDMLDDLYGLGLKGGAAPRQPSGAVPDTPPPGAVRRK